MNDNTGLNLPYWFSGGEVSKLANAAGRWFAKLQEWAFWPARQMDARTCSPAVLDLLAYQRGIDRFPGEPLELYRLRVHYAYANAVDAGEVSGFARIMNRLGVGYMEQEERMPGVDWDIIDLCLSDSQLSRNQALLKVLLQDYGRTCRRYRWSILSPQPVAVRAHGFGCTYTMDKAVAPPLFVGPRAHGLGNDYNTDTASI